MRVFARAHPQRRARAHVERFVLHAPKLHMYQCCAPTHTHTHTRARARRHTRTRAQAHTHTHARTRARRHARCTHTYTHRRTHTRIATLLTVAVESAFGPFPPFPPPDPAPAHTGSRCHPALEHEMLAVAPTGHLRDLGLVPAAARDDPPEAQCGPASVSLGVPCDRDAAAEDQRGLDYPVSTP
jgi:hypothetical protein